MQARCKYSYNNKGEKTMQMANTVTLTREEVIKDILDFVEELVKENSRKYMEGDLEAMDVVLRYRNVPKWSNEEIMQTWCDMCSDKFFYGRTDIEDVLMATTLPPVNGKSYVQKEWLCNKYRYHS
jgi:hypothetical protein